MTSSIPVLHVDAPVLVFGGPYSNLEATEAVLAQAEKLSIPCDRIICTGDVVAYGADPIRTAALVRDAGIHVVRGNCEESLAAGAADCGCGFPAGSACEGLSSKWFAYAERMLDSDARTWMGALPRRIDLELSGARLAVIHGGVDVINRFVFASTDPGSKRDELNHAGVSGIIAGHCGIPFSQTINGRLWHNAGAVGMPANDGTPRGWFSILTPGEDGISIEHHAITYEHRVAGAKMRDAGLPEGYAAALETGLWPSCDVLPFREIRARGVPIEPGSATWNPVRSKQPSRRRGPIHCEQLWPPSLADSTPRLPPAKFTDPLLTADGEPRARVELSRLRTLWFNTGTLCNIACRNCYIESSPRNDRLAYITRDDVALFLDEISLEGWGTDEIGFTGGEPFMNPEIFEILEDCLSLGFRVLVLSNAMRPMQRSKGRLMDLNRRFGANFTIRVSLDHFTAERHEDERGSGTFKPTLDGLIWLARNRFSVHVAGRTMWNEDVTAERAGYAGLFAEHAIPIDADDHAKLVLFPEMDARADVPEITTHCWRILGKSPADVMCATSRMVVKDKGSERPAVVSCTLLPYDERFMLGHTLKEAAQPVPLNHPHCAKFCVLGGASCSAR
jgi:predicted phosphodiesterase/pyruvate-formate lyase-activating enzyme